MPGPHYTHPIATPIAAAEYRARRDRLLGHPETTDVDGFVWWGNHRVFYLCGFAFAPTERPIALLMRRGGETVLFVPRLEVEHAEAYANVDRVVAYPEYPDVTHPMTHLTKLLRELGLTSAFGGDGDGAPRVMGYRGPKLSEASGASFVALDDVLEATMQVKSPAEIALIRESAYWAGRAHRLLQDATSVGRTETEVEMEAGAGATAELLAAYRGAYRALSWGGSGPFATYRGQIGAHSALPHSLNVNAVFAAGDTLVTGASCPMFGYWSELERTMFIGDPSVEQGIYFGHMLALQDLAIDACRAGRTCSSVDGAVRDYFAEHDLGDAWRHHTGHNVGIRYHEGPFLDVGDDTVMESGMLFTVEPGLYVPGLGGFRHSDTIVVTDDEPEFLTDYPRDLDRLVLDAA
ncbi:MAG: aminopeptidase P family protein [Trueperaceae bacterium]|nr:aminopeptidase P family protein [Trueperaceae bacterium]